MLTGVAARSDRQQEASGSTSAAYLMGRTERERRRLLLQGAILNPLTERFLQRAGLSHGMRVLDIGCGIGDVSLVAAEIAGPTGEVIGIDLDEEALRVAEPRAIERGYRHLTFERADFNDYRPAQLFDAVVARHVLIHASDPLSVIRKAGGWLHAGGLAAFEEYDLSFWPAGYPNTKLAGRLEQALVKLFRGITPHANVGMRLFHLLHAAGFREPQSRAECLMEGSAESDFYEWLAETVRSVLPAMEKFGLAGAVGDPDTLTERLRGETLAAGGCIRSPLIVGAFARKG